MAGEEVLSLAYDRLLRMTAKMKSEFPAVGRWEQTEDVLQNAAVRLHKALTEVPISDVRHFYRLAALNIRRELIDLCRHHLGPQGRGGNHQTAARPVAGAGTALPPPLYEREELTQEPARLAEWAEFHERVETLSTEDRELFDLLWYNDLSMAEAAEVLDLSTRQVRRKWRAVRLRLHEALGEEGASNKW